MSSTASASAFNLGTPTSGVIAFDARLAIGGTIHRDGLVQRTLHPLLDLIYDFCAANATDDALDAVFDGFDGLFTTGRFDVCDRLFLALDLNRVDHDTLVGMLTVTLPARRQLIHREALVRRVEIHLLKTLSSGEVAPLLDGLR